MLRRLAYTLILVISISSSIDTVTLPGPVLLIVGTRPEIIKMAPVFHAFKKLGVETIVCSTDQHTDSHTLFDLFEFHPDIHLNVMKPNQDLFHITTSVLDKLKELYLKIKPSLVIVQGDTTSAMSAALAAFYLKIPVAHIEAGLRTYNMNGPFPEEFNRRVISLIAAYHCAPTDNAAHNLLCEGVDPAIIFVTGNTVVDALYLMLRKIAIGSVVPSDGIKTIITHAQEKGKKIVLFTAHRRESFEYGLLSIFTAIKEFLETHEDVLFIYPVHPNPKVHEILEKSGLKNAPNIILCSPLSYVDLIYVLNQAHCVVTDSGGLQEEAASLDKCAIVLREETERTESIDAGLSVLVGYDKQIISQALQSLLVRSPLPTKGGHTLYGNGMASEVIADILMRLQ